MNFAYKGQLFQPSGSSLPSGGTTDQILAKASDADGDVVWKDCIMSTSVKEVIAMTESGYNALETKVSTTLYITLEEEEDA